MTTIKTHNYSLNHVNKNRGNNNALYKEIHTFNN